MQWNENLRRVQFRKQREDKLLLFESRPNPTKVTITLNSPFGVDICVCWRLPKDVMKYCNELKQFITSQDQGKCIEMSLNLEDFEKGSGTSLFEKTENYWTTYIVVNSSIRTLPAGEWWAELNLRSTKP